MVPLPRQDLPGAVELLQQHDPRQLVREGHFGHGQTAVGPGDHLAGQAQRAADDEHGAPAALVAILQQLRQPLAGQLRRVDAQGDHMVRRAEAFKQRLALLLHDPLPVGIGGMLRLGQVIHLDELGPAVPGQALQVLGAGVAPVGFLEPAHAQDQLSHGAIMGMTSSRLARTSST